MIEFSLTDSNPRGLADFISGIVTDNIPLIQKFLKKHGYTTCDISEYLDSPIGIITDVSLSSNCTIGTFERKLMFGVLDEIGDISAVDYILTICDKNNTMVESIVDWYLSFGFKVVAETKDKPLMILEYKK